MAEEGFWYWQGYINTYFDARPSGFGVPLTRFGDQVVERENRCVAAA